MTSIDWLLATSYMLHIVRHLSFASSLLHQHQFVCHHSIISLCTWIIQRSCTLLYSYSSHIHYRWCIHCAWLWWCHTHAWMCWCCYHLGKITCVTPNKQQSTISKRDILQCMACAYDCSLVLLMVQHVVVAVLLIIPIDADALHHHQLMNLHHHHLPCCCNTTRAALAQPALCSFVGWWFQLDSDITATSQQHVTNKQKKMERKLNQFPGTKIIVGSFQINRPTAAS